MKTHTTKTKAARRLKLAGLAAACAVLTSAASAQLAIPNADGSDGVLNVTSNTVIYLANAAAGSWTNTSASPGNGTYDASQWAIIFKYSSVNIASNATLVFSNHYSHAPVVWLVTSNVTINGNLSLDGQPGTNLNESDVTEPGPGGFRGGAYSSNYGVGVGMGPGGGNYTSYNGQNDGQYLNYPYGTANIVPLIGGSGGSGYNYGSGGGGGGAILIAASGTITINGSCHANGGTSLSYNNGYSMYYGYGSGGAVRLVANQILGSGQVQANSSPSYNSSYPGRIRLEANTLASTLGFNPVSAAVAPANPPLIFPATNAPTATVISVGGAAAPADPRALMSASPGVDDISIAAATSSIPVMVQTQNFPTNGTVNVYVKSRVNAGGYNQTITAATLVNGNSTLATWQAMVSLPYPPSNPGQSIVQVRAVLP